jgi:DNA-binding NarL/FixJ family response regulator
MNPPAAATTLLIVDDAPQVRRELRCALTLGGGVRVVGEAADGAQAIRLAERLQPEVILMDLAMPGMDGCQAASLIKARCPACRVIALTVHDQPAERRRALQAGMDAFVVKGASLESLMRLILNRSR